MKDKKAGVKLPLGIRTVMLAGLERMKEYYAPIIQVWPQATPEQRAAYLEHSPVLAAVLNFARPFFEVK